MDPSSQTQLPSLAISFIPIHTHRLPVLRGRDQKSAWAAAFSSGEWIDAKPRGPHAACASHHDIVPFVTSM